MKSNKHAGQFKLRGKKLIVLTCRCCTVENWKEECRKKEDVEEMRLFRGCGGQPYQKYTVSVNTKASDGI